jgi:glycerol-3-phosphate O-acyltransferase / dihydroxyacetone phosphate acyltransferase
MNPQRAVVYAGVRGLMRLALGFYFRRIERFHEDRVPLTGPVLFTSNHPNSLTDSFVIGASVVRKVNFVATVQLFRFAPLKWFLTKCGVIPINRLKDDPRGMRSIVDTFEACYGVLEKGEAVGIFPEGVTYEDSQLREVKTGAARMALELEHRHLGRLGLKIVPVGITYSAKERYRSEVLVHFGNPILVSDSIANYGTQRKECIRQLTGEIEGRLRALIVDTPAAEQARVVEGVKRLYLERLLLGNSVIHEPVSPSAGELLLTQAISKSVKHVYASQPARAAEFARKLAHYEGWLKRLRVSDESLTHFPERHKLVAQSVLFGVIALLGAPLAVYGWIHRILPYAIVRFAQNRFIESGKKKAQTSTATIAAGIIAFGFFYSLYVCVVHLCFGWPVSFWYALTLPLVSILAHYYLSHLSRLRHAVGNVFILARAPVASKRLLQVRAQLISEIDSIRTELRQAAKVD